MSYALRDVKNEIDAGLAKGLKVATDSETRKQLVKDRRTILIALETAAQSIEKQYEEQEEEEKGR